MEAFFSGSCARDEVRRCQVPHQRDFERRDEEVEGELRDIADGNGGDEER